MDVEDGERSADVSLLAGPYRDLAVRLGVVVRVDDVEGPTGEGLLEAAPDLDAIGQVQLQRETMHRYALDDLIRLRLLSVVLVGREDVYFVSHLGQLARYVVDIPLCASDHEWIEEDVYLCYLHSLRALSWYDGRL